MCVAVLDFCQGELMELEAPEIRHLIMNLPDVDMDQVILQAHSILEDSDFLRLDIDSMFM